jgi:hypothetical protein
MAHSPSQLVHVDVDADLTGAGASRRWLLGTTTGRAGPSSALPAAAVAAAICCATTLLLLLLLSKGWLWELRLGEGYES